MLQTKLLRSSLGVLAALCMMITACSPAISVNTQVNSLAAANSPAQSFSTGIIYTQPRNSTGGLLPSSWWDPSGSDSDQYVWDDFTLSSNQSITDIQWYGGYDPTIIFGAGAVVDFRVQIYPSITGGSQPDVNNPPLVSYQLGNDAGQTALDMVNGINFYSYSFTLPAAFNAVGGTKYWIQIEASENGTPDWGIALGTGGDGHHFKRTVSLLGDPIHYSVGTGDAAFTLLGPVAITNTPTFTPTFTPANMATDTPTNMLTFTPTNTSTFTPTNTAVDTPTFTPINTATDTAAYTPTNTLTFTPTYTPADTPTSPPTNTPAPTPLSSTPGKVTGGGTIGPDKQGTKATFGFTINYSAGDIAPKGSLVYQDHKNNLRLKAISFDLLVIEGNHAWFTGTGIMDNGQTAAFEVEMDGLGKLGQSDTFYIYIPSLNGYQAGGALSGGNITIH